MMLPFTTNHASREVKYLLLKGGSAEALEMKPRIYLRSDKSHF